MELDCSPQVLILGRPDVPGGPLGIYRLNSHALSRLCSPLLPAFLSALSLSLAHLRL